MLAYGRAMAIALAVFGLLNFATLLFGNQVLVPWWAIILLAILWPFAMAGIT